MERRESLSGRGVAWENEVAAVRGGRLCVAESKNGGHALETPLSAVSQGDNLVTPQTLPLYHRDGFFVKLSGARGACSFGDRLKRPAEPLQQQRASCRHSRHYLFMGQT